MGAWSTRIFDNDTAADVLGEYRLLLGYGVSPKEAYALISAYFGEDYIGEDDEDDYWLAIAYYQWKNGILEDEVKENALRCLSDDSFLERWKESGRSVYEKRKATINEFREKLLHETNPTRKKFPKCPAYCREKTKYKVGDLLAYEVLEDDLVYNPRNFLYESLKKMNHKFVFLRVVSVVKREVTELMPGLDYRSSARVMLYNWYGDEIVDFDSLDNPEFIPIVCSCEPRRYDVASNASLRIMPEEAHFGRLIFIRNKHKIYSL